MVDQLPQTLKDCKHPASLKQLTKQTILYTTKPDITDNCPNITKSGTTDEAKSANTGNSPRQITQIPGTQQQRPASPVETHLACKSIHAT